MRSPPDMPIMITTEIGAKNGFALPIMSPAIQYAIPAAIPICRIGNRRLRTRINRA